MLSVIYCWTPELIPCPSYCAILSDGRLCPCQRVFLCPEIKGDAEHLVWISEGTGHSECLCLISWPLPKTLAWSTCSETINHLWGDHTPQWCLQNHKLWTDTRWMLGRTGCKIATFTCVSLRHHNLWLEAPSPPLILHPPCATTRCTIFFFAGISSAPFPHYPPTAQGICCALHSKTGLWASCSQWSLHDPCLQSAKNPPGPTRECICHVTIQKVAQ